MARIAALALLALSACAGPAERQGMPTIEQTPPVSPSTPLAPTTSAEPAIEIVATPGYPYPGYPKVVRRNKVPAQMRDYIDSAKAVAVAPGVWTQFIPGVTALEAAQTGAYIGYCAAVEKAIKKVGNESGFTCW